MTTSIRPFTEARIKTYDESALRNFVGPRLARDRGRFQEDIKVDMAHVVMLTESGIISYEHGAAILAALCEARDLGDDFPVDPKFDSMLLQIERFVSERAGPDAGGRMHIGRSRIDRQSAIPRLHARNRLLDVHDQILRLTDLLLSLGQKHIGTIMPGWTHLQHAQPWTLGHYMMRQFFVFERHLQRTEEAFGRTNLSALGGAALVGTSWPLDRYRVCELLGHDDIVLNSQDAGAFTMDWSNEVVALLSMIMVDLGRLAGDLILWHTWEFNLIELSDEFCGSSSIMPQKKNPSTLEHIRSHAGFSVGWFASQLSIGRSASSTDCDPPYAPFVLDEGATVTVRCLDLMRGVLGTMKVNDREMERRAGAHWSTASALADAIVRTCNLPFRSAHAVVGRLVRNAIEAGVMPADVTSTMVDDAAEAVIGKRLGLDQETIAQELDPRKFVESRITVGSLQREQMEEQLRVGHSLHEKHVTWWEDRRAKVDDAGRKLDAAVAAIMKRGGRG